MWFDGIDGAAKMDGATTLRDVVHARGVELGERNSGHAHAPGFRRFEERFAEDLRGVMYRGTVEVFIQRAHQDNFPEAFDGAVGLSVALEPGEKVFAGVWRESAHESEHYARDCELVFQRQ